jgi:Cu-Zn family superoxide dismutase
MKRLTSTICALACAFACVLESQAQEITVANARLIDAEGRVVGLVRLHEAPSRGVLMRIEVSGLLAGMHAIQIHERGRCEPPVFASAGARLHDRAEGGEPRAGRAAERMNLRVPGEGRVEVERVAPRVTLASGSNSSLFDEDGSAILIYAGAEGEGSDRAVVCGVIQREGPARR